MNTIKERRIYLRGDICGPIWWPVGAICGKPISTRLDRHDRIEDAINSALMREGGDFQDGGRLTADSVIEIEHVTYRTRESDSLIVGRTVRSRMVPVSDLPSLADMVDSEHYGCDF